MKSLKEWLWPLVFLVAIISVGVQAINGYARFIDHAEEDKRCEAHGGALVQTWRTNREPVCVDLKRD